jgi:hypothetical protein
MRLNSSIQHWVNNSVSALSSGFQGMLNSGRQHHQASQDILAMTQQHSSHLGGGVTVRISDAYHERFPDNINVQSKRSIEDSIVSLNEAGVTYSASAKLVRARSTMLDALFDTVA